MSVCLFLVANYRPQFLLDRLGRYLKLFVSTVAPFSHELANQIGLAHFCIVENPKDRVFSCGQGSYKRQHIKFENILGFLRTIFENISRTFVLSHVKTNNKSPTKYFELDSASCRAAKELSVDTNRASLRQLLAAQ